jgi:hypothetical protein
LAVWETSFFDRKTWGNLLVLALLIASSFYYYGLPQAPPHHHASSYDPIIYILSSRLFVSVIGAIILLWYIGTGVCAALGNIRYICIFVIVSIIPAIVRLTPTFFPSAAIAGIVGMGLIFFPHRFNLRTVLFRTIRGIISVIFIFTVLGPRILSDYIDGQTLVYNLIFRPVNIGFISGVILAIVMLLTRWVKLEPDDCSLPQWLHIQKRTDLPEVIVPQKEVPEKIPNDETGSPFAKLRFRRPKPDDPGPVITLSLPELYKDHHIPQPTPFESHPATAPRIETNPVHVPGGSPHHASLNTSKPSKTPSKSTVVFTCVCGQAYQLPVEKAGKKARCYICKNIITVPENPLLTRIDDLNL